jgi:hypothetical protein
MRKGIVKQVLVDLDEDGRQALEYVKSGLGTTSAADTFRRVLLAAAKAMHEHGEVDYKNLSNNKSFRPRLFSQLQLWRKK